MRFGIASGKRADHRDVKVQSSKRIAPYARESASAAAGMTLSHRGFGAVASLEADRQLTTIPRHSAWWLLPTP
jgi:hypothetical protein